MKSKIPQQREKKVNYNNTPKPLSEIIKEQAEFIESLKKRLKKKEDKDNCSILGQNLTADQTEKYKAEIEEQKNDPYRKENRYPDKIVIDFISFGCSKTQVDLERMLGRLGDKFVIDTAVLNPDIVIVNACGFIDDAKIESVREILRLVKSKSNFPNRKIVVTGCLAERYKEELTKNIPEIAGIIPLNGLPEIERFLIEIEEGKTIDTSNLPNFDYTKDTTKRYRILDDTYLPGSTFGTEYLKIADGCSNHCTYCIIPSVRGEYRSVDMEAIVKEAEELADDGVREFILTAQDTTNYGVDLYGKQSLHILVKRLAEIEEIKWIRILNTYPDEIYDELIDVIANEPKIVKCFDMPIQHCNDEVLKQMNRRTTKADIIKIITNLRESVPGIALRTSVIAGFPGETQKQFNELLHFIKDMKFEHLSCFAYSQEEGTPAALLNNQVPLVERKRRTELITNTQNNIKDRRFHGEIGKVFEYIVTEEETEYVSKQERQENVPKWNGFFEIPDSAYECLEERHQKALKQIREEDPKLYEEIKEITDREESEYEGDEIPIFTYYVRRKDMAPEDEYEPLCFCVDDDMFFTSGSILTATLNYKEDNDFYYVLPVETDGMVFQH
jgi:ribosomal protein S12 methylthiotransferase